MWSNEVITYFWSFYCFNLNPFKDPKSLVNYCSVCSYLIKGFVKTRDLLCLIKDESFGSVKPFGICSLHR